MEHFFKNYNPPLLPLSSPPRNSMAQTSKQDEFNF